jgi:hypothetical protein
MPLQKAWREFRCKRWGKTNGRMETLCTLDNRNKNWLTKKRCDSYDKTKTRMKKMCNVQVDTQSKGPQVNQTDKNTRGNITFSTPKRSRSVSDDISTPFHTSRIQSIEKLSSAKGKKRRRMGSRQGHTTSRIKICSSNNMWRSSSEGELNKSRRPLLPTLAV